MKYVTALRAGLVSCHACGRVEPRIRSITPQHCSRCGARLHRRNPDSLMRTWALLLAAALLYIPANLLPVMHTSSLLGSEDDTIMSGVVYFWTSGDWPLAVIVFIASIMVPMLKLSVLVLLTITAQRRSRWRPMQRTKLYRMVADGRAGALQVNRGDHGWAWRHCVRLGGDSDHDRVDAIRPTAHLGHRGRRGQQWKKEGETRDRPARRTRQHPTISGPQT